MANNSLAELEELGVPASSQKFLFDCTLRTIQKFKASSDESGMERSIYKKAALITHSMKSEEEHSILEPLFSGEAHLLLCLSGLLSLGAQYGREETSPGTQGADTHQLDEETLRKRERVLGSGLEDVLDVLSSEYGAAPDEAAAASAGVIARFDRLAAADLSSNPWVEMAAFTGNIFSRMKAMEAACRPHYEEILRDVRMPVYESLCDVLRGPAGRKLYEVLRRLHDRASSESVAE